MPNGTPSAFFSYSRHDSEFVLKLANDLRAAGAAVWLDQLDISPGQRWDSAIEKALANCPHLLVVLSPSSVESTNVMDEVSFALEENKVVIPVLYRDCKTPFRLRRLQYIDARVEYERGLAELLKMLGIHEPADSPASSVSSTTLKEDAQLSEAAAEGAAKEKANQEWIIRETAETERRVTERSAAEAREREKTGQERMARDRAAAERLAKEKTDAERIAGQKEEFERQSARKAEQEQRDREAAEVTPGTSRTKYLIAAAAAVVVLLALWAVLPKTHMSSVGESNASAYVNGRYPASTFSTKNEIEPDSSEWVKQFLNAGEGPSASRLRPYFDDVVSPYFSLPTARWDAIERDKQAYFERFPTIHYSLLGRPQTTLLQNKGRILEFDMQYSNLRMDGRTLKGRSHLTLNLRSVDGGWRIAGISERKVSE